MYSRFIIKNYKGNLLESIQKFSSKNPKLIISKVYEENKNLVIEVHKMSREELDDFDESLENNVVKFIYKKKDGSMRDAVGTRNEALIPSDSYRELEEEWLNTNKRNYLIGYYDLDKDDIRSFHVSRFEEVVSEETPEEFDAKRPKFEFGKEWTSEFGPEITKTRTYRTNKTGKTVYKFSKLPTMKMKYVQKLIAIEEHPGTIKSWKDLLKITDPKNANRKGWGSGTRNYFRLAGFISKRHGYYQLTDLGQAIVDYARENEE